MDFSARTIPPAELCDRYIALGGGTSRPVVQGLWDSFGKRTATLMGAGANTLAATWQGALSVAGATLPAAETFSETALAAIYQDAAFVPSLTLDQIGPHLSDPAAAPTTPRVRTPKPTASPGQIKRRRAATSPQR